VHCMLTGACSCACCWLAPRDASNLHRHESLITHECLLRHHAAARFIVCLFMCVRLDLRRRRGDITESGYLRARRKDAMPTEVVPLVSRFLHRISRIDNNRKGLHRVVTGRGPNGECVIDFHANREFDFHATHQGLLDMMRGRNDKGEVVGDESEEWQQIQALTGGDFQLSRKIIAAAWCVLASPAYCCRRSDLTIALSASSSFSRCVVCVLVVFADHCCYLHVCCC
jgi:hypothetical protein